jgi:predicted membrane metal-binding protein
MVIIFLHAILFFLPFYFRLGCVFVGVILYAMLCGADSSVVRATLMALLTMTALMFGRSLDIMRLLAYTFVVMIIINPYYLIADVGFLLSFGAVI